jgi:hypothetical protein
LGSTFLPVDLNLTLTSWEYATNLDLLPILYLSTLALICCVGVILRQSWFMLMLVALFIGANVGVSIFLYSLDGRHFGLWVILLIGVLWLEHEPSRILERRARALFLLLALAGMGAGVRQLSSPFALGSQIMQVLKEHDGLNTLIIPIPLLAGAEVHSLLGQATYDITGGCRQSFIRWRFPVFLTDQWVALDRAQRQDHKFAMALAELKTIAARAGGHVLLLVTYGEFAQGFSSLTDHDLTFLRKVQVGESEARQIRYLYRLDVVPQANPAPFPDCQ